MTTTNSVISKERKVIWFSCGVSSFIAGCLTENAQDAEWIRIFLPNEEKDSERFLKDCEEYVGVSIKRIADEKGRSVDDIIEQRRYINGVGGAPCTGELKRKVRLKWEKENLAEDESITYVWGFDVNEKHRAQRMLEAFPAPKYHHEFPLIDAGLTKADCHGILKAMGIKRPRMYDLGYPNNNCIMCVKAGMGYFDQMRKDFPEEYEKRAKIERELGHSCIKKYFLDELPEGAGRKLKPIPEELVTEQGTTALEKIKENIICLKKEAV